MAFLSSEPLYPVSTKCNVEAIRQYHKSGFIITVADHFCWLLLSNVKTDALAFWIFKAPKAVHSPNSVVATQTSRHLAQPTMNSCLLFIRFLQMHRWPFILSTQHTHHQDNGITRQSKNGNTLISSNTDNSAIR